MKRPAGFDGSAPTHRASSERPEPEAPVFSLRSPDPVPAAEPSPVASLRGHGAGVDSASEASGTPAADERPRVQTSLSSLLRRGSAPARIEPEAEASKDPVQEAQARLKRAERDRIRRERREQRRFTEHVRKRRRRLLIVGAAVLGLALFVIAGVFTPIMAVRDIQVTGAETVSEEELRGALSGFEGTPLALVSDVDVHRALEAFPLVQRYSIERIPPHTLIVRIEERVPVIALERESGIELLDAAGVLLGRVDERPVGVPMGTAAMADTSSPAFIAAATVVRDMPEDISQQLVSVSASSAQDVTFTLSGGTEVIWGEAKLTQQKAVVLRALLASIGTPTLIDLTTPDAPVFK